MLSYKFKIYSSRKNKKHLDSSRSFMVYSKIYGINFSILLMLYGELSGIVTFLRRTCQNPRSDQYQGSDEAPTEDGCVSSHSRFSSPSTATCYIHCTNDRCNKDTPSRSFLQLLCVYPLCLVTLFSVLTQRIQANRVLKGISLSGQGLWEKFLIRAGGQQQSNCCISFRT